MASQNNKLIHLRILLACWLILAANGIQAQDSLKLRKIDSIVFRINNSSLPVQRDTLKQDYLQMGIATKICLSAIVQDGKLLKYENHVISTTTENGVARIIEGTNCFYFDNNKLVKVEEHFTEGEKTGEALWYYDGDTSIYYTLQTEKGAHRATLLLTMAKSILDKMTR